MRTIKLKDGTFMTVYNVRYSLGNLIYDYLGADAGNLFDEYIDSFQDTIEDCRKEIKELKEELYET
ncbi:MAG: hypothetical protein KBT27_08440 [Prevotellaceae bacterium]|nr:hypothetical protein [Candidatus Faecinaster equi]